MAQNKRISGTMRRIAKLALAAFPLIGFGSAHASPVSFNLFGAGPTGAVEMSSPLGVRGSGFVMVRQDPGELTRLLFSEVGAYQLIPQGVTPVPGSPDLTLVYSVVGTLNPLNGALGFSGGSFSLFSDDNWNFGSVSSDPAILYGANDGTRIASFQISSGGNLANGSVRIEGGAVPGSVLPGYFFSGEGVDLSQSSALQFAVDIGNIVDPDPSPTVVSELVCKAADFPGPGCNGSAFSNTPYYFVVSDGGSATLSTSVPEPGSAALMFLGMAGLGFVARRSGRRQTPPFVR